RPPSAIRIIVPGAKQELDGGRRKRRPPSSLPTNATPAPSTAWLGILPPAMLERVCRIAAGAPATPYPLRSLRSQPDQPRHAPAARWPGTGRPSLACAVMASSISASVPPSAEILIQWWYISQSRSGQPSPAIRTHLALTHAA